LGQGQRIGGCDVTETVDHLRTAEPPVPTKFSEYLRGMGPGLVVALSWLGTGDLINSSVSGANYGYALLWALAIATLARFFVVSALSKYQLCNSQGDQTILDGFERVWRGFPMLLGIFAVLLGFVYHAFLFLAAGTSLYYLFGQLGGDYGIFVFAIVVCAVVIFLATRPKEYRGLEVVAQIAMAFLVVTFLYALISSGFDFLAFLRGLFFFAVPPQQGAFGALVIVISIIGAVGGSVANLMYPYFIRDKGWHGPRYRKLQVFDLLFGVVTLIVLNFMVWIVAAELLRGRGETISAPEDLARMMELAIGPIGPPLMWLAIFFTVFDNISTQLYAFPRMMIEAIHKRYPARAERYGFLARAADYEAIPVDAAGDTHAVRDHPPVSEADEDRRGELPSDTFVSDPLMRWIQAFLLFPPLVFSLPQAPNLIVLTIFGNALQVIVVPAIIVGLIWITSSRRWMLQEYVNRWWENAILLVIGAIGLWATYNLITETYATIAGYFGS
jgi:Mn2+/Fe2+ NRAMP family transporter